MKKPQTGGRFIRDAKTKKLSRAQEPTREADKTATKPVAATEADTAEKGE